MQTKDMTVEYSVRFQSNKGNFNHQPVFTMINNEGLTGDDFISLYRIRRSTENSQSITAVSSTAFGLIGITVGSSAGLTSVTGVTRIRSNSITSGDPGLTADYDSTAPGGDRDLTNLSVTSRDKFNYRITTSMTNTDRIDVTLFDESKSLYNGEITITGLPVLKNMNFIGTGIRPRGKVLTGDDSPDGTTGKSEVVTFLFNRMGQQTPYQTTTAMALQWTSSGLTGVFDTSFNGLSGALRGKAAAADGAGVQLQIQTGGLPNSNTAAITGWTAGPIEGSLRLDNGGFIEGVSSSLYNTRDTVTTGMTVMTYVRFHATGSTQTFLGVAGNSENSLVLKMENGNMVFSNKYSSISAGAITSDANIMCGGRSFLLNRWYHVTGKIHATGSQSGMSIYINGEKSFLARTISADSASSTVSGGSWQTTVDTSADLVGINEATNPRLLLGTDRDFTVSTSGAQVAHDIGITRVFNRPLTDSEIFQNYIATIPSNAVVKSVKVG